MTKEIRVWGMTAEEIVFNALFMTWDEPICRDVDCKCSNSVRWRAAQAVKAVREFEIANRSAHEKKAAQ